jgi:hypothetical protein
LKSGCGVGVEYVVAGVFELLDGEEVWRGKSAGKGDDFRILRKFEQVANSRTFDGPGAMSESTSPGG